VWSVQLAATDSALGCARREVRRVVDGWGLDRVAAVAELLALELVNAAMGGTGQPVARLCYSELLDVRSLELRFQLAPQGLVIATWEEDPRPPRISQTGMSNGDGSALYWVPMLAETWDSFRSGTGKVTWCEIRIPHAGEQWLPRRRRHQRHRQRIPAVTDLTLLGRVRDRLLLLDTENHPRGQP